MLRASVFLMTMMVMAASASAQVAELYANQFELAGGIAVRF